MSDNRQIAKEIEKYYQKILPFETTEDEERDAVEAIQSILDRHYPVKQDVEAGIRALREVLDWIDKEPEVFVFFKPQLKRIFNLVNSYEESTITDPVTDVEEIRRQFALEILNGFINKSLIDQLTAENENKDEDLRATKDSRLRISRLITDKYRPKVKALEAENKRLRDALEQTNIYEYMYHGKTASDIADQLTTVITKIKDIATEALKESE